MHNEFNMVRNFTRKTGVNCPDTPTELEWRRCVVRHSLMSEELNEYIRAVMRDNFVDQIDALIDLMYVALGTLAEMGVNPTDMFEIVHEANLRKFTGSKIIVDEKTGKIQKPENWYGPEEEIKKMIDRMRKW